MKNALKKVDRLTREWLRHPVDEVAALAGCRFDLERASRPREFLRRFCVHTVGQWEGQPFELIDWQWFDLVAPMFGWIRPDGTRRFRRVYCQVAKKNGKTTLISGLGLYGTCADGEPRAEVYLCACDLGQSSKLYEEASAMVAKSGPLSNRFIDVISKKRIVDPKTRSFLRAMPKGYRNKDGLNAHMVIFDELHRQPDDSMYKVMRYAGRSRRQPLHIDITTAGNADDVQKKSLCFQRYSYAKSVLKGDIKDIALLPVIYEPDEGDIPDGIHDPKVWKKANPSMGITMQESAFKEDLIEAESDPNQYEEFLQLSLNIWVQSRKRYIPADAWELCGAEPVIEDELIGMECYGGGDLGDTSDLTAWVLLFPTDYGTIKVLPRFFVPEESAIAREKTDGVPYRKWREQSLIIFTPGKTADYDSIKEKIIDDNNRFALQGSGFDPWNVRQLIGQLKNDHGVDIEPVSQGYFTMTDPMKQLLKMVIDGKLEHGNNEILNWMAGNVRVKKRSDGSCMIDKDKSIAKVDGISAICNGLKIMIDRAVMPEENPEAAEDEVGFDFVT